MVTLLLAFFHSMSSNKDFQPTVLYLGTVLIDLVWIEGLTKTL